MARKPRIEIAGGFHHVYARGNRRQRIYVDDADREVYLTKMGAVVRWAGWRCLSYCLMSNHVHMLVQTPQPNLGQGMRALQGDYARAFNDRHGVSGHVFDDRFKSKPVNGDEQLLAVAAYIARNPVEAGLRRHPADWRWSSYGREGPAWIDIEPLLEVLAAAGGDPRRRYDEIVGARPDYDPGR